MFNVNYGLIAVSTNFLDNNKILHFVAYEKFPTIFDRISLKEELIKDFGFIENNFKILSASESIVEHYRNKLNIGEAETYLSTYSCHK